MTLKEFKFSHKPVLLKECIEGLKIKYDGIYVDCTTGGAGHSAEILKKLGEDGLLICLDKDDEALKAAEEKLSDIDTKAKYRLVKSDFKDIGNALKSIKIDYVDGILADFGVSSHQLDENSRGFGYMQEGPLDMRMDTSNNLTAKDVVNKYTSEQLEKIFFTYGEEKYTRRIVSEIIKCREDFEIETTSQLSKIVIDAMPRSARREQQHPAKRVFQAIRIEVNNELESIKELLEQVPSILKPGGRFLAISFHSLEDRLVKEKIKKLEDPCECPKSFPVCNCGKKPIGKAVNKKVILASPKELEENPRARSAKLRIFEKYNEEQLNE